MKFDPKGKPIPDIMSFMGNIVVPRPIAWVTTVGKSNIVNLAPFSLFNLVTYDPVPVVFFSPQRREGGVKKDTLRNIEENGEFVVNMVTEATAEAMNLSAGNYPPEASELKLTKMTPVPSDLVKPPRILESPINLECKCIDIRQFGKPKVAREMVLGEVLRVHLRDDLFRNGIPDVSQAFLIGRMGTDIYTRTRDRFNMKMPLFDEHPK